MFYTNKNPFAEYRWWAAQGRQWVYQKWATIAVFIFGIIVLLVTPWPTP